MIVHSGGKTTVVDLEKAIKAARGKAKEKDPGDAADGEDDDFFVSIENYVPKGQVLQTTVILLVDRVRRDDDPRAHLVIDSIESTLKAKPEEN